MMNLKAVVAFVALAVVTQNVAAENSSEPEDFYADDYSLEVSQATVITNPENSVVVHDSDDYKLTYTWQYVRKRRKTPEHVVMNIDIEDANTGDDKSIFGFALSLVGARISGSPGSNPYLYMQGTRMLGFTFDYSKNGAISVKDTALVHEFCKADASDCNKLGGWRRPQSRIRSQYVYGASNCNTKSVSVKEVQSSQKNGKQTLRLVLELYQDAYQTCSISPDDENDFMLDFTADASHRFVHAMWYESSLEAYDDSPLFYHSMHSAKWDRSDKNTVVFTAPIPTDAPTLPPTTRAPRDPIKDEEEEQLVCPNDYGYIRCSSLNQSYKHLRNDPERRAHMIKFACTKRHGDHCTYCPNGRNDATACRPKISENDRPQNIESVCASSNDPFEKLGCVMWVTCPRAHHLGGCGSVNQKEGLTQLERKRMCLDGGFVHDGKTIQKEDCFWCRGWCRTAGDDYKGLESIICNTPGLYDIIMQCPGA